MANVRDRTAAVRFLVAIPFLLVSPALMLGQAPVDAGQFALVRAAETARVRLVERLAPTVVCIFPKGNHNGGGSGVIIDPEGYGITNYHVVASLGAARQGDGGLNDGRIYPLEVLGIDPAGDIAMFKLSRPTDEAVADLNAPEKPLPFAFAPLGDSDAVTAGDWTLAMGNPFLLAEDFKPTVTFGIVAGNHRYLAGSGRALIYTDCIEIGTSINPGNSGGPLFNMAGELVGINGRIGIEERGRVNVGVGYSVGVNQIKRFLPALRAGLVTQHATLGATAYDKGYRDVCIDQILEDSDAYKAGLRLRDRVLSLNGREIRSANALLNAVGACPAQWPTELRIRRGEQELTLSFRMEALPLPKMPKPPHGMPEERMTAALTGPNEAANILEVRRRLRQARNAIDGMISATDAHADDVFNALDGWTMKAGRTQAKGGATTKMEFVETRSAVERLDRDAAAMEPQAVETAARWSLMARPGAARRSQWRITGSDCVRGRIAVVIDRICDDGRRIALTLDDATGELVRVAFEDVKTGKAIRYDYSEFRREGPLRLPHRRVLYLDGQRFAEDRVESYVLKSH